MLRYTEVKTPLHLLDPRSKLALVISVFVLAFLLEEPLPLFALLLFEAALGIVAKVPLRIYVSLLKIALPFAGFYAVLQATFFGGKTILAELGPLKFSVEGLSFALVVVLRLLVFVALFPPITYSTNPSDLAQGLAKMGLPLEVAMTFDVAFRFLPFFFADIQTIKDAQRSRGLELDKGIFNKLKGMIAVAIPLIIVSLKRAHKLTLAAELRALGATRKRTYLREVKMRAWDHFLVAISGFTLILGVAAKLASVI